MIGNFVKEYIEIRGGVPVLSEEEKEGLVGLIEQYTPLAGEIVLMTGFRDNVLSADILAKGGDVANNWSRKVTILVTKTAMNKRTAKIQKAEAAGVRIIGLDEFKEEYKLRGK